MSYHVHRLYFMPPRPVEFMGEWHMHSTVGPTTPEVAEVLGLEQWTGFSSKRPIECEKCLAGLEKYREELIQKYLDQGIDIRGKF